MRADRLVATLLVLQARGRVTARQLAEELETSVATARRDLEALSAAGIPVYPQPGRGGGWSLIGGARTDLTGLTASEAQALFLLVGPTAAIDPQARAALRKLVQALPPAFRGDAEAAAQAVMIDPTRWGDRERERPALVDELQRAIVGRRRVRLVYEGRGASRGTTERLVDPWGLIDKDDVWYLVAGTDAGQRTFRVDRMIEAEVTDQVASRPDDLELADIWRSVVDDMEQRRSRTTATVLIDRGLVRILQDHFGRHCTVVGAASEHRARVEVSAPTPLDIARQLAGWGTEVEVLGPPAVQAHLARIGTELAARYLTH